MSEAKHLDLFRDRGYLPEDVSFSGIPGGPGDMFNAIVYLIKWAESLEEEIRDLQFDLRDI